jgi:secondary thiamine-phosphate synthase enzyme
MWQQQQITLQPRPRGYHLITEEVVRQLTMLRNIDVGLLHLFIQHTSASLLLNENADPTVRQDLETHINKMVPDDAPHYIHTYEGPDDMPAHIKCAMLGPSVQIPVSQGKLALGTWQGIYLGEHRIDGGSRSLIATIQGD